MPHVNRPERPDKGKPSLESGWGSKNRRATSYLRIQHRKGNPKKGHYGKE